MRFRISFAKEAFCAWRTNNGWRYSPLHLYGRLWNSTFDWIHGVDTRTMADLPALTIGSRNKPLGEAYEGSPVFSFRRLLRRLDIPCQDYAFVDFGSGKGRTLLLAGELPFKQVIGVEFSAELNHLAARNISRYRRRKAQRVATLHCDATEFALPDENLVLYFFNPFKAEVLDKVLANISASLAHRPRKVILVYLNLRAPDLLGKLGGGWTLETWHRYRIYTCTPRSRHSRLAADMAEPACVS
ncbi:MAG: class I SAM-dependent methyltransferase [Massilia sp.]